jgi:Tol biopolymer transport system component
MNKKAIIILGAIFFLIVGTLGFLIYSKYGGKSSGTPVTPVSSKPAPSATSTGGEQPAPVPATTTPVTTGPRFLKLLNSQVVSPVLCYNGQGVTYLDPSGQLYQATFKGGDCQNPNAGSAQFASPFQIGAAQSLGIQTRSDISRVIWPPAGDNFIVEIAASGQKSWSFYNSDKRLYADLPSQVKAFDWLPSGKQVYYIWLDDKGKATLNVGDGDTSNYKKIADMWETDDLISVSPDGKTILYYEQNASTSTNPIYSVSPDGKVWKTLVSAGQNYGVLWSPDSQKFLFGKKSPTGVGYQLWYYNIMTQEIKSLGVVTSVAKAVWDDTSRFVFAAVPANGTPDDSSLTRDSLYRIDPDTLERKQYDPGDTAIDARSLFLSKDGTKLFFKNAQDGSLYYLDMGSGS